MAKLFCTDTAMRVTTDAVQVLGGYGYVADFPVERYMREAKALQIVEGTNQIQRMVIGAPPRPRPVARPGCRTVDRPFPDLKRTDRTVENGLLRPAHWSGVVDMTRRSQLPSPTRESLGLAGHGDTSVA